MDVKDAIIKRKSIRKYDAAAVPLHIIAEVLDAARRAPSARNAQPWRFLVVQDRQTIEALKARRSTAQGGGREAAETLGRRRRKQSPERAAQSVCIARA
jgi:nitroreductase